MSKIDGPAAAICAVIAGISAYTGFQSLTASNDMQLKVDGRDSVAMVKLDKETFPTYALPFASAAAAVAFARLAIIKKAAK